MSQEDIIEYLKKRPGIGSALTADELQVRLDLGTGLYENLKRLRPYCGSCSGDDDKKKNWIEGNPKSCPWCGKKLEYTSNVRCIRAGHRNDSRRGALFYYWVKDDA